MEKVLVIEDNNLLRENIHEILSHEGYTVFSAENGQVGVEKALEHYPDLIVSDINMPIMDGYGVLEQLREYEKAKTTPFIFLTVKNTMQELRRGMNLGADDYLTKPFDMNQLLMAVRTRLDKKNQIVAVEEHKYDQLKNAVGLPITAVIDDPLRNIERLAEMVTGQLGNLSSADVGEITKLIATDASKLRNDINKVLFFYRIEALKSNPESMIELKQLTTKNLDKVITYSANAVTEELNRQNDLHIHLETGSVKFPKDFLDYLIKELLTNACRYSTRGTNLRLTGQSAVDGYRIAVQDQGVGFSESKTLEDVAPYIRLSQHQSKSDGLGLGLYNVKTLVSLFDGKIILLSEPGIGTSITITLPLSN